MAASLNNTDIRNLSSDRKNVLLSEGQMECLRMKNSFYAVFMSIDFWRIGHILKDQLTITKLFNSYYQGIFYMYKYFILD